VATNRTTKPSAQKRPKAAAPMDVAERVIRRLVTAESRPVIEELPLIPVEGTGTERPVPEWVEVSQSLYRCFAFIDICGFTAFTDREGTHAAVEVLNRFRSATRDVTGRRGVRVIKWLGDGAMLVGIAPGPVVAAAAELELRCARESFDIHSGVAGGTVLLFEGDDYIGRPVNLAARLCEAAGPGEILAAGLDEHLPDWVERVGSVTVRAAGIGDITDVAQIRVPDDAWASGPVAPHHPSLASVE